MELSLAAFLLDAALLRSSRVASLSPSTVVFAWLDNMAIGGIHTIHLEETSPAFLQTCSKDVVNGLTID